MEFNFKLSLACVQRLTHSSYCYGNCTKAGDHLQHCGWLDVWGSQTGGVSDSERLASSKNDDDMSIVEMHSLFQ